VARAAFVKAAWPFAVMMLLAVLLVNANDLVWQQATWQDLAGSTMSFALEELDFEHSGVALGYPVPALAGYALAAAAFAIWHLPRLVCAPADPEGAERGPRVGRTLLQMVRRRNPRASVLGGTRGECPVAVPRITASRG
jgi:hypothetical protein